MIVVSTVAVSVAVSVDASSVEVAVVVPAGKEVVAVRLYVLTKVLTMVVC